MWTKRAVLLLCLMLETSCIDSGNSYREIYSAPPLPSVEVSLMPSASPSLLLINQTEVNLTEKIPSPSASVSFPSSPTPSSSPAPVIVPISSPSPRANGSSGRRTNTSRVLKTLPVLLSSMHAGQNILPQTPVYQAATDLLAIALFPNRLLILQAGDHQQVGEAYLAGPPSTSPLIDTQGRLYMGTLLGTIEQYSVDGSLLWQIQGGESSVTSLAYSEEDSVLYASLSEGLVMAINPETGSVYWQQQAGSGLAGQLSLDQSHLYVGDQNGLWFALNTSDGLIDWRFGGGSQIGKASALTDGTRVILSYTNAPLYQLTTEGYQRWRFSDGEGVKGEPLSDADGNVFFVGKNNLIYSLSSAGIERWHFTVREGQATGALTLDQNGHLYVLTDRSIFVLDPEGTLVAKQAVNEQVLSGLVLDNQGKMHVLGISGRIQTYQALAPLAEGAWAKTNGNLSNNGSITPILEEAP